MYKKLINFVQDHYQTKEFVPLHAPTFGGNEKKYVNNTLDSTFVSSVGKYVDQFEQKIAKLKQDQVWTKDEVVELFLKMIPEFGHKETGKYLDGKM